MIFIVKLSLNWFCSSCWWVGYQLFIEIWTRQGSLRGKFAVVYKQWSLMRTEDKPFTKLTSTAAKNKLFCETRNNLKVNYFMIIYYWLYHRRQFWMNVNKHKVYFGFRNYWVWNFFDNNLYIELDIKLV